MTRTNNYTAVLNKNKHIGIFILRLFLGIRLFYGVIDNILNWDKMNEFAHFLEAHQFPIPLQSAILSVYVQFLCSILLLLGLKTRLACFVLVLNFIIALVFVHLRNGDSIEVMTPALAMLFGCLALFFTGADKISLDNRRTYLKDET